MDPFRLDVVHEDPPSLYTFGSQPLFPFGMSLTSTSKHISPVLLHTHFTVPEARNHYHCYYTRKDFQRIDERTRAIHPIDSLFHTPIPTPPNCLKGKKGTLQVSLEKAPNSAGQRQIAVNHQKKGNQED